MYISFSFVLVSVLVVTGAFGTPLKAPKGQDPCATAFQKCIFGFQGTNGIPAFTVAKPGEAISPPFVYRKSVLAGAGLPEAARRGNEVKPSRPVSDKPEGVSPARASGGSPLAGAVVGAIDEPAEAYVVTESGLALISKYECPTQPFSNSFIKATDLGTSALGTPTSGLSLETAQGDQADCLDNLCVIMTITKWQSFNEFGVMNLVSPPEDLLTNCAVFRLKVDG